MKKILYLLIILITIGCISSCRDMDSIYEKFVVPSGLKYPQRPDSLRIQSGYNKLRIKWLKAKDPSITYAIVYWNNYHDSVKVDIPQNQDTVFVDVDNLTEGNYTFHVKTFDNLGNSSIPTEISGSSYGDNYLIGATDRTYSSALRDDKLNGTIIWNRETADLVYTEVRYKTNLGTTKTVRLLSNESTLKIADIKPGELFEYRSVFLPKDGIDSVARNWRVSDKPFLYKYPRIGWTAEARNGNHDWGDGGGGQTFLLFDSDKATGWHSRVGAPFPQCVVVDMKESLPIDHIIIIPPGPPNWRYLKDIAIYMSDTPLTPDSPHPSWGEPDARATYQGGESFTINFPSGVSGQYAALVFPNSTSAYISFMEFDVFGY